MAGTAVGALSTAVGTEDFVQNEAARNRFNFFSGKGAYTNKNNAGSKTFQSMQELGTATSSLDAAAAAMAGNSMGIMSGLGNYGTIQKNVAGISNLIPGIGLEASMGATAALNQASSVNKLRMIGINVRDQSGYMRNVEDIARDLWKSINNTKGGGKAAISAKDLSFSLQSGNSLDMLLNQYFGTDQVLRQGIISYLYQFAAEGGNAPKGGYTSDAGKASLLKSGATTGVQQSYSNRYAVDYNLINANTTGGVSGITDANNMITAVTKKLAGDLSEVTSGIIKTLSMTETILGAANGAIGMVVGGVMQTFAGARKAGTVLATGDAAYNVIQNLLETGKLGDKTDGKTGSQEAPRAAKVTPSTGFPTLKGGTLNANTYYNEFAVAALQKLGDKVTPEKVQALVGWMNNEGTNAKFNPFASTVKMGAKNNYNDAGVQNYDSAQEGVDAFVKTLNINNPGYKDIRDALKNDSSTEEILTKVGNSAWNGSGHYNHAFVTFNLPNVTNIDHPDVQQKLTDWWNKYMADRGTKRT
jgi:hypothetical protein